MFGGTRPTAQRIFYQFRISRRAVQGRTTEKPDRGETGIAVHVAGISPRWRFGRAQLG